VQLSTAGMFVSVTNENEGYMVLKSWQNEASSKKIVPLESLMSELPPYGVDPDMTLTALANLAEALRAGVAGFAIAAADAGIQDLALP
jgi:hypothetical protein